MFSQQLSSSSSSYDEMPAAPVDVSAISWRDAEHTVRNMAVGTIASPYCARAKDCAGSTFMDSTSDLFKMNINLQMKYEAQINSTGCQFVSFGGPICVSESSENFRLFAWHPTFAIPAGQTLKQYIDGLNMSTMNSAPNPFTHNASINTMQGNKLTILGSSNAPGVSDTRFMIVCKKTDTVLLVGTTKSGRR